MQSLWLVSLSLLCSMAISSPPTMSKYLSIFPFSLIFTQLFLDRFSFFFFWMISRSGCLTKITWSVCITKSLWILCVSSSRTCSGSWIYYLVLWSNFNFLYNFKWITLMQSPLLTFPLYNYHYFYYYQFAPGEFIPSASLESEKQQVSSSLQDSSQYSSLHMSAYFQVLQS